MRRSCEEELRGVRRSSEERGGCERSAEVLKRVRRSWEEELRGVRRSAEGGVQKEVRG